MQTKRIKSNTGAESNQALAILQIQECLLLNQLSVFILSIVGLFDSLDYVHMQPLKCFLNGYILTKILTLKNIVNPLSR